MNKKIKLGDSELELLRYVARNPGCTVRDASETFAQARGWSRTTVLKTFDRLREKDLLRREESDGVFQYTSAYPEDELERTLVHQFVTQSMEGSLRSVVAYLQTSPNLTDDDVAELRRLVDGLEKKQK